MAVQCQVTSMSAFISHFRSLNDSVGKSTHQTKAELINGLTRPKRKHREQSIKSNKKYKKENVARRKKNDQVKQKHCGNPSAKPMEIKLCPNSCQC